MQIGNCVDTPRPSEAWRSTEYSVATKESAAAQAQRVAIDLEYFAFNLAISFQSSLHLMDEFCYQGCEFCWGRLEDLIRLPQGTHYFSWEPHWRASRGETSIRDDRRFCHRELKTELISYHCIKVSATFFPICTKVTILHTTFLSKSQALILLSTSWSLFCCSVCVCVCVPGSSDRGWWKEPSKVRSLRNQNIR